MRVAVLAMLILLCVPSVLALTASMGSARMVLRPEVPEGQTVTIQKTMQVNNVNDIPIKVTIEAQDAYKLIIEVIDSEIELQPGETVYAKFNVILKSGGNYTGRLAVGFSSADPLVKEAPVGLASNIVILASGPVNEFYDEYINYVESTTTDEIRIPIEDNTEDTDDQTDETPDEKDGLVLDDSSDQTKDATKQKEFPITLLVVAAILIVIIIILIMVVLVKKVV